MAVTRHTGSQTDCKTATVDMTGKEGLFAKRVAGGLALITAAGQAVAGVITEGKAVGLHTSIVTGNQSKVIAGAAIAVGDDISTDANGKARVAVAGDYVVGKAMSAAANGEFVEFEFQQQGLKA